MNELEKDIQELSDIEVGDILLIKENEPFPADLVLLSTNLANGMCYI